MCLDRPLSPPSPSESPDIAHLRHTHTTQGYREGITASKTAHLQDGFDEGYVLGGRFGLKLGWLLGVVEGLWFATRNEQTLKLQREAGHELVLEKIFASEFFGNDGVWTYSVGEEGKEEGKEVTLDVVVERHPLMLLWVGRVREEAVRCGLVVEELGGEEKEVRATSKQEIPV